MLRLLQNTLNSYNARLTLPQNYKHFWQSEGARFADRRVTCALGSPSPSMTHFPTKIATTPMLVRDCKAKRKVAGIAFSAARCG
jgi:hypothetical protein